jgi:hypothetical protein
VCGVASRNRRLAEVHRSCWPVGELRRVVVSLACHVAVEASATSVERGCRRERKRRVLMENEDGSLLSCSDGLQ